MPEVQRVTNDAGKDAQRAPEAEQPYAPLVTLRDEVDRVFDQFFRGGGMMRRAMSPRLFGWEGFPDFATRAMSEGVSVRSDFAESDDSYELTVEMPGLTDKDVEVSVSDNMVTVKGEKKQRLEKKEENYHLKERSYGAFRRVFSMPQGTKAEDISAKVKDGVLTVTMPKTPEAKKKPLKIKVGTS